MIIAAHQPNFIPWLGLFYKIYKCDKFIFVDDVQISTNNGIAAHRNIIKTPQGIQYVRVPIHRHSKTNYNEALINYKEPWVKKLEKTLYLNYQTAPFYEEVMSWFMDICKTGYEYLSELNIRIIEDICIRFDMDRGFEKSSDYHIEGKKEEMVLNLVKLFGGDVYYSGTGAADYLREEDFEKEGMKLIFSDYSTIRYKQIWRNNIDDLSVLDYLFNCGFHNPFPEKDCSVNIDNKIC